MLSIYPTDRVDHRGECKAGMFLKHVLSIYCVVTIITLWEYILPETLGLRTGLGLGRRDEPYWRQENKSKMWGHE